MSHWSTQLPPTTCAATLEWACMIDTYETAWATCERGDWMLELAAMRSGRRGSAAHRAVVRAACACARLALPYVMPGERWPRHALDTAKRWAQSERGVTIHEVRSAAAAARVAAAYAAAYAVNPEDGRWIAPAAAAARAAAAAVNVAAADDDDATTIVASDAHDAAAYAAATRAASAQTLVRCAKLVRALVPRPALASRVPRRRTHG